MTGRRIAAAEFSANDIKAVAEKVIAEEGFDYPVQVEVTKMWFETRSYEGFSLPAGDYDAVRIIIGSGEGKNWWCVMYPALCVPGAEADVSYEYGKNASFVTAGGYEIRFADAVYCLVGVCADRRCGTNDLLRYYAFVLFLQQIFVKLHYPCGKMKGFG